VLRAFACRIRAEVRAQDATYRYGGEEFAVLLPETTLAGGATVARRLVSAVAVEPFRVGPRHLRITCSAGVAALCGTETGEELVARADGALYAAKQGGRNRAQEAGAGRTCSRRKR
jgi:diguanylate cyclase (GGDEF)-like protein